MQPPANGSSSATATLGERLAGEAGDRLGRQLRPGLRARRARRRAQARPAARPRSTAPALRLWCPGRCLTFVSGGRLAPWDAAGANKAVRVGRPRNVLVNAVYKGNAHGINMLDLEEWTRSTGSASVFAIGLRSRAATLAMFAAAHAIVTGAAGVARANSGRHQHRRVPQRKPEQDSKIAQRYCYLCEGGDLLADQTANSTALWAFSSLERGQFERLAL